MSNLAANLIRSAERSANRVAIRLDDAELTYAQLENASQLAVGLLAEHGVHRGDRVGIMVPNVPQWAVLYYGALRAGAVAIPMNPLLKEREIAFCLRDSGARVIFVWDAFKEEAEAGAKLTGAEAVTVDPAGFQQLLTAASAVDGMVECDGSETAVILYTSGTTGQPKGAELSHANLGRNAAVVVEDLLDLTSEDIVFGGLPLFHVFGQTCGLNASVVAGACLTLLPRFDPSKALEILARDHVTVFEGVPTMYGALVHHPDWAKFDLSALRLCVTGGSAMPVEIMRGFERNFGCSVLEGYGLTETSPVASFNHPDRPSKPGSIGTPIRGVEMRVVDDQDNELPAGEIGEIVIRGHNVMKGYWKNTEATEAAMRGGWFHSGDLARTDEDGYYFIVDRKTDMIIRGGYNVYPREVEDVLYEHPAVAEVAVIGVPHPELGQEVGAAIKLKPGATASADELRDFVKGQLAAYKYPRYVQLFDALPKGPTEKILKRQIILDTDG
jgi:long-chain acyl-CoA synthetase